MKNCLKLFLLLCAFPFLISCNGAQSKLIGTWSQESKPEPFRASYVFNSDGTASILRGKSVVKDGLTWSLNSSQTPMHLDLAGSMPNGQVMKVLMIVEFVEDNKIQISSSGKSPAIRPTGFGQPRENEEMTLVKQ